ncbi:MAG: zinc ribbon domain-containing protein [Chthoniobacterales bacterium]|nr:zinc ribbon domain-containing protein [Chthoniobacterales bacterium]
MKTNKGSRPPTPEICPVCGEDVPRGALACPDCGADHNSGWREDAEICDAVDLRGDTFDYDEFVRNEFGSSAKPAGVKTIWWIVAIVLLIAFAALYAYSA